MSPLPALLGARDSATRRVPPRLRAALSGVLLVLVASAGCAPQTDTPEEFPPVRLGMTRAEVQSALDRVGARVQEESERALSAVGRDRRVTEEVFLFYEGRLAAWTLRYAGTASRGAFQRLSRRFTLSYGEPFEQTDDGWVQTARWRLPRSEGRVLLSGLVGGADPNAPLMVRVEDPSVVKRLIRQMSRDSI